MPKHQIDAVIFDMDGTLACTEHLWRIGMINCFRTVNLALTEANCIETIGMKIDQVVEYWHRRMPWDNISIAELTNNIVTEVDNLISQEATLRHKVEDALIFFRSNNLPLAIASSSALKLINTTVKTLSIDHYFETLHSAEFEEHGKPNPAVYLSAAKALKVDPQRCLAFEDSVNGIKAAKAAGMHCIAVQEDATNFEIAKQHADFGLETFEDFHQADFLSNFQFGTNPSTK
jgi:HAD superfamily hydrolase (TIGR01509 family)